MKMFKNTKIKQKFLSLLVLILLLFFQLSQGISALAEDSSAGAAGDAGTASEGSPALIDTGSVDTGAIVLNEINQNDTALVPADGAPADENPASAENTAPFDPPAIDSAPSVSGDEEAAIAAEIASSTALSSDLDLSVGNENEASTTNQVNLSGQSGGNAIGTNTGASLITTGDVGVVSIIINFINKNIFGRGTEFFINIWNDLASSIDLSGFGGESQAATAAGGACAVNECMIAVNNVNTGEIVNDINIKADTGGNLIASAQSGQIETGDINIINDVLNIANLNITGNDWFFAVVNIFGELEGDIILPAYDASTATAGAESGLAQAAENEGQSAAAVITNANNAAVLNEIKILADTGANEIASSGEALINTGQADIQSKVFNLINYNLSGDTWKFSRINLFGSWQGFIHGLPAGYSILEDESGITVYSDVLNDPKLNEQFALMSVSNQNSATTTNRIDIEASTGDNKILHAEGGAAVSSGNINIYNSLLNFINSNFTGDNWSFSMINVFGSWAGDLSFGQPDLWVSEGHNPLQSVKNGDYVTYTFLYGNNGDLEASNVVLVDDFDESLVSPALPQGAENIGGKISWNIGNIPPRSQGSFSYTAYVGGNRNAEIRNQASIFGQEGDRNPDDNYTSASLALLASAGSANRQSAGTSGSGGPNNVYPSLKVGKTNSVKESAYRGESVDYQISIQNTGTADLYNVLALDVMTAENSGEEIQRKLWDLDTIRAGEEVLIEYTVVISEQASDEIFDNEVVVEGFDRNRGQYIHAIASTKLPVIGQTRIERIDGPDLALGFTLDKQFYNPGDLVQGKIIVTNNGQYQIKNIDVSQDLPPGLTSLAESGNIMNKWSLDWLNPGQIEIIDFAYQLDSSFSPGSNPSLRAKAESKDLSVEKILVVPVRPVAVLGYDEKFSIPEPARKTEKKKVPVFPLNQFRPVLGGLPDDSTIPAGQIDSSDSEETADIFSISRNLIGQTKIAQAESLDKAEEPLKAKSGHWSWAYAFIFIIFSIVLGAIFLTLAAAYAEKKQKNKL